MSPTPAKPKRPGILEGIKQNVDRRYLHKQALQDLLEDEFPDQPNLDFGLEQRDDQFTFTAPAVVSLVSNHGPRSPSIMSLLMSRLQAKIE